MNRKQKLAMAIRSQFRQPRGFAGWLAGWEMALRSSNRQRNVWAVSLLGVEPTDRVLEIGFGPGIAIRELSRRATHGLVCGVDHSAVMVRQATRRNAEAVRAGRVDLRLGAAEHPPAFAEPFDKVLAVNNMGMWREPDEGLKALHRLMRPGGRIAIVSQPRCPGAPAETTVAAGREIAARLTAAGFTSIWSDTLALKPPRYLRARGGLVKPAVADSFSRNPIYLAFSIFQLGIASWVNSVWLIATLIAAVALMASVVIPREERYLERRFGADYLDYKRSVRRWL